LCLFAWEAEKARPSGLLINAVEFRHRFGDGLMKWRDQHIIPRYGAAGVQRFAFVMPAGLGEEGKGIRAGAARFPTRVLRNRDHGLSWLRATSGPTADTI